MRDSPILLEQVKLHDLEPEHITKIGEILDRIGVEEELLPEHTLSYLVDLWVTERQKGAQGDAQAIGELETLILSADAFQGGKPGNPNNKPFQTTTSGQNPYFLPNKMLNDDKNVKVMAPQVAELIQWLDEGKIVKMSFTSKFLTQAEEDHLLKNQPYGQRLVSGLETHITSNDYHEYLSTKFNPHKEIPFSWDVLANWPMRLRYKLEVHKFDLVAILPNLQKAQRTVEDVKTEKKLWRTVTTRTQRTEHYHLEKSDERIIFLSMASPRKDSAGRVGLYWSFQAMCKKTVADKIYAEVSKSPQALFNYFVETVPGFKELEGDDFSRYRKAVDDMRADRRDPAIIFSTWRYDSKAELNNEFGSRL